MSDVYDCARKKAVCECDKVNLVEYNLSLPLPLSLSLSLSLYLSLSLSLSPPPPPLSLSLSVCLSSFLPPSLSVCLPVSLPPSLSPLSLLSPSLPSLLPHPPPPPSLSLSLFLNGCDSDSTVCSLRKVHARLFRHLPILDPDTKKRRWSRSLLNDPCLQIPDSD